MFKFDHSLKQFGLLRLLRNNNTHHQCTLVTSGTSEINSLAIIREAKRKREKEKKRKKEIEDSSLECSASGRVESILAIYSLVWQFALCIRIGCGRSKWAYDWFTQVDSSLPPINTIRTEENHHHHQDQGKHVNSGAKELGWQRGKGTGKINRIQFVPARENGRKRESIVALREAWVSPSRSSRRMSSRPSHATLSLSLSFSIGLVLTRSSLIVNCVQGTNWDKEQGQGC